MKANFKKLISGVLALMLVLAVSISTVQAAPGDAEFNQGITLINEGKPEAAVAYLIESAEAGNPKAFTFLGLMTMKGVGVEKDVKLGFKLLLKAANMGEPRAQYYVSLIYGQVENYEEALYWMKKSAEQGFPEAVEFMQEVDDRRAKKISNN